MIQSTLIRDHLGRVIKVLNDKGRDIIAIEYLGDTYEPLRITNWDSDTITRQDNGNGKYVYQMTNYARSIANLKVNQRRGKVSWNFVYIDGSISDREEWSIAESEIDYRYDRSNYDYSAAYWLGFHRDVAPLAAWLIAHHFFAIIFMIALPAFMFAAPLFGLHQIVAAMLGIFWIPIATLIVLHAYFAAVVVTDTILDWLYGVWGRGGTLRKQ